MFRELPLYIHNLSTYSIMLVAAFLLASYLAPRELLRKNLRPEIADMSILIAVIAAIIGSKVGYVFEVWGDIWLIDKSWTDTFYHVFFKFDGMRVKYPGSVHIKGLWATLFSPGGLVFYGGFAFSFTSIYVYLRRKTGAETWKHADALIPSLAVGYAIGRLGCLISGDGCYGHAASIDLPIVTMVYETPAFLINWFGHTIWNSPVQPSNGVNVWNTPVIESIASFALFLALMLWVRYQNFRHGFMTAIFLVYNGTVRFFVEFLRLNDAVFPILPPPAVSAAERYTAKGLQEWYWYGINQPQIVALCLFAAGATWIILGKLYQRTAAAEPTLIATFLAKRRKAAKA